MKPKKVERLRFKLGVKLYQLTGYLSHFCRDAENEFLKDNLNKFFKMYSANENNERAFSFSNYVSLQRGIFQCDNGIHRPSNLLGTGLFAKIYQLYYYKLRLPLTLLADKYKI